MGSHLNLFYFRLECYRGKRQHFKSCLGSCKTSVVHTNAVIP